MVNIDIQAARFNLLQRWIFYLNFPFVGVAFVLVPIFLRLHFTPQHLRDQLKRVDWVGSVLFIGSTTSFLIPITWGGVTYAWDSWRTLVPLILGSCGLIAFAFYEEFVAQEPLIRPAVFKNRTSSASYITTVLHGIIVWCLLFYLPLYYEAVKGESPLISGVSLFPQTFTVAPASVVAGIAITKTGRYRWALWIGWALTVLGCGLLYLLDANTSVPAWIFLNLVSGVGLGLLFPSMGFSIQAASTNEDLAFAVAMFSFFRAFGQAIGVAIGGTIFQNTMKRKLMKYPLLQSHASEYSQDASSLVRIIKAMESSPQKDQLIQGYADSLKVVWAVLCGLAFIGLLVSFLVRGLDLNRPLETEQGLETKVKQGDEEKEAQLN